MDICLECGDVGTSNAFVYCVNCLDCGLHRYCMEVVTFDEFVPWVCDDCEVILLKQSATKNHDAIKCNKSGHTVSEDIELSSQKLKKCDTLAFQSERTVCEGDPTEQSPETSTEIGSTEYAKSKNQRDNKRCSPQSCESDNDLPMGEHTTIEQRRSSRKSKTTKRTIFCEANLEDHGRDCNLVSNSFKDAPRDLQNVPPVLDYYEPALPVITHIWRGSFNIKNKDDGMLDEFVAHVSSKSCQKVFDEASKLHGMLNLEMLPKARVWPKSFLISQPRDDSIALYFFPSNTRYERIFDDLVEEMVNEELAMKGILSNAELLIFTSLELPPVNWRFQGKYYLWGVFRGKQVSSDVVVTDGPVESTGADKPIFISDSPNDLDTSGAESTLKAKNLDPHSPLSPLSTNGSSGLDTQNYVI